ncbi:MAG: hypothetical protein RMK78_02165 [Thermaurantiacus sp.]|uniref:hypothetical protein n=1 Tax=Thermaurantiacus sp. TaxID=2820283 RepID=UPI00298EE1C4|nr:hypothetical protein [Thermaurantiacus sp.]MDW8414262.1 hypothetical protein [Thermaurantiacus sp.]
MVPPADGAASAGPPDPALARLEARLAELEARLMAATERPQVMPTTPSLEARIEALDKGQRALAARLQTFERRLASVGLAQGAALAERSQALLLLTAARRHVERGRPLGALEPRVAELFGPRDPSAVAALAAWSRAPVSASLLAERLHEAPPSATPTREEGWWTRLRNWVSGLVEVRRRATATQTARARAAAALARGDTASAVALLEAVPEAGVPKEWLADGRRLAAAEAALDRLELIVLSDGVAAAG